MTKTVVLIVEDEAIVAADLARKVEQLGYEVAGTAMNGQDAVALALRLNPDLVLMDIWLKGSMDGIEAADRIRRERDIPVVYLTAHSDPTTLAHAKVSGPFGYILKPFESRDLAIQIEMALYRHQADRQLREQREWLRVTIASIGDAVIATDAEGRITFLNSVAELLTGWISADALHQPIQSVFLVVNEQTGLPLEGSVSRVLSSKQVIALSNHAALIHRDGHSTPIEDSAAPILDAAGRMIGVVLVFHDVTQKRRADEALEKMRNILSEGQKIAHVGTFEFVADTQTTVWSEEEYRIYGLDPAGPSPAYDVMLAKNIHPDDAFLLHRTFMTALQNRSVYELEHRIVRPDGGVRVVYDRAYPYFDDTGKLIRYVGATLDITERKQAEAALRESEQRFRLALRNAPVSVAVQDRDLRYVWAYNQRTAGHEDIIGKLDSDIFTKEEAEHITQIKRRILNENVELREQMWINRSAGQIFLDVCWVPIRDDAGSVVGVGSATVDLTPIKRVEEALIKAKDELEQRVSERTAELAQRAGQLRALAAELSLTEQRERSRLAKVLHDHLQQLLVGAKFRLAILGKGAEDLMKRAIKEVEDLIDGAVSVSRDLTAELNPPILQEAGLNAGLQWLVRRMADKHGLFVDLEADRDGSIPEQLKILIFDSVRELLFNIVKHAHTSRATVNVRHLDDYLQVTVSDPGIGFDPAAIPAAGGAGVGYGLFSTRERLELVGGTLQVHSTPGVGSRLIMTVPISQIPEVNPQSAGMPALPSMLLIQPDRNRLGQKVRILLADDHAVVRQGIANMLGNETDFEVVGQAADGKEAVELAAELLPDVILMDISMPKLNGIEATRIIHRKHPEIRIVGLSMFEEADTAHALRNAGASEFITKSGPVKQLIKAIRTTVSPSIHE